MNETISKGNGYRVFFLYPHPTIRELIPDLVREEYEAYLLEDHTILNALLERYKSVILFINIDQVLKEEEWERIIKSILANSQFKEVKIGILSSFKKDQAIIQKYLLEIGVQCGYLSVEHSPDAIRSSLLKTLEANEARGQRKYIRAICNKELDTFNTIHEGTRYEGYILNLSIVGMACVFKRSTTEITLKTYLKNIQLILRGARCIVSGIVSAIRANVQGENIIIIMFVVAKMENTLKEKIHNFIYYCNQQRMMEDIHALQKNVLKEK